MGGVETDEHYVGVDRQGIHYALPVQAKGGRDHLSVVQIEQDIGIVRGEVSAPRLSPCCGVIYARRRDRVIRV